jgi:hypothetical protein
MIIPRHFDGAQYVDALPNGMFAVLFPDHFLTHVGRVSFPPSGALLHHRVGVVDGQFCIAGQGHNDGLAWLWNGDKWLPLTKSHGTSVAAFGPRGVYVSTPDSWNNIKVYTSQGSQVHAISRQVGARGIAAITGPGVNPADVNSVDDWYGRGGLAEFTAVGGDILIGQGAQGGLVIKHDLTLPPRVIEPGHVEFTRSSFANGWFAVSAWKTLEKKAVIYWFEASDIASFPQVKVDVPIDPIKPIDPEEPKKPVSIPDDSRIVHAVNAAHPHLLEKNDHDSVREFYWRAAWALHQHDPRWGMLGKEGGGTHQVIAGLKVAEDAIAYKDETPIVDIIVGANNPPHRATVAWQVDPRRRDSDKWVKPPQFPGAKPVDPIKPKDPVKPVAFDFDTEIQSRIDAALAPLKEESAAQKAEIAALKIRLDNVKTPTAVKLPTHIGLKTAHGRFVVAEPEDTGFVVRANRDSMGDWETFELIIP